MDKAKIPETITADGKLFTEIKGLIQDDLIGGKAAHKKVMTLIKDTADKTSKGMDGEAILDNIATLRKDARSIYAMEDAGRKRLAVADTSIGVANALEGLLERHLEKTGRPDIMNSYRDGRKLMAKTYTVETAADKNTGKINPAIIAKMTAKDNALDGPLADMGKIAGNFPDIAKVNAKADWQRKHLTRGGPGGAAGAAIGLAVGGPVGMGAGALGGAATGEILGMANVKRILRPSYQQENITPQDFRPMRERLGYPRNP